MKYPLILLVLFVTLSANAQTATLNGSLLDSASHNPVAFATLYLFRQDSPVKPLRSGFSTDEGRFRWSNLDTGIYVLKISTVGYRPISMIVDIHGDITNMTEVLLQATTQVLKEVTITATKPLLEVKADRIIYNAESDPTNAGATTAELLRKVPFLSVDMDDKLKLKGQSNFKVQLNGRSTGIFARDPSEAVRSLPASLILRVEVITTPGARYDAEGIGGIINIVTVKKIQGTKGSLNAGINTLGAHTQAASLFSKQGKWGFSVQLSNSWQDNWAESSYSRTNLVATELYQEKREGDGRSKDNTSTGFVEIAYDLDSLTTLSLHADLNKNKFNYDFYNTHTGENIEGLVIEKGNVDNLYGGNSLASKSGFDMVRKFRKAGRELSASYLFSRQDDNNISDNSRVFQMGSYDSKIVIKDANPNTEHTVDLNFSEPLNEQHTISMGFKSIFRNISNDYATDTFDFVAQQEHRLLPQSGVFHYQQAVYSAYGEHGFSWKKWSFLTGLRYEYTDTDGDLNGANEFDLNYRSLFPSFNATYRIGPTKSIHVGVSRRIQRPSLWYLNPQVDLSDPRNIRYGNPLLQPEYAQRYEVGWSKFTPKGTLSLNIDQTLISNVINSFTYIDPSNGFNESTFQNNGHTYQTGLNVFFMKILNKKWSVNVQSGLNYQFLKGFDGISTITNDGISGNCMANIAFNAWKRISISATGLYYWGSPTLQGSYGDQYNYSLSIRRTFLKNKKLYISLNTDLFAQRSLNSILTTSSPAFEIRQVDIRPARLIRVSANWRFGKLRAEVSRKRDIENGDLKAKQQ